MADTRKQEIEFVLTTIDRLCNEFKIALIPERNTKGLAYVGILDNTTGKKYAMIKKNS